MTTAVHDEAVHKNPCIIRGAGQAESKTRDLLTLDDVERITAAMPEHYRSIITVAFWSHLRIGEVVGLRHGDIVVKTGKMKICNQVVELDDGTMDTVPKWSSDGALTLPDQGRVVLAVHLAANPGLPNAKVWTHPSGAPLRAHHVHYRWEVARAKVGLHWARFHDLRHASLTLVAQMGATTAETMARGRHLSAAAALAYQHAAASRDVELAGKLSDLGRPS